MNFMKEHFTLLNINFEMKILHIITGLNDGGAEAILYRLCKFNKSQSHHVISLSGPGKYGDKLEKNRS